MKRFGRVTVFLAAIALMVTACGSKDSGKGGSTGGNTAANGATVSNLKLFSYSIGDEALADDSSAHLTHTIVADYNSVASYSINVCLADAKNCVQDFELRCSDASTCQLFVPDGSGKLVQSASSTMSIEQSSSSGRKTVKVYDPYLSTLKNVTDNQLTFQVTAIDAGGTKSDPLTATK